jgi:hypothetical protein
MVETVELDKQLLANLRDLRPVLTGDALDQACSLVKNAMADSDRERGTALLKRKQLDSTKLRTIIKCKYLLTHHTVYKPL